MTPIVLGLDLSLTCTGVAGHGWADTIPTGNRRGHERVEYILATLADRYLNRVDLAVIEGLAFDAHDTGRQNAGLSWLVRHTLWRRHIPYALVPPSSLKQYAVGKGGASKGAVIAAVRAWYPWFAGDDNAADAAVLATMGLDHLGRAPMLGISPTRAALAKVTWPEPDHG